MNSFSIEKYHEDKTHGRGRSTSGYRILQQFLRAADENAAQQTQLKSDAVSHIQGDRGGLCQWGSWKPRLGEVVDFLALFPASFIGWLVTGFLLSLYVPKGMPHFDALTESIPRIKDGGMVVVYLGVFTIALSVIMHIFMHFPAMWGMMFGLALLGMFTYFQKRKRPSQELINVYANMEKVENDTLLFFFGILSAVGALHFMGFLEYVHNLYGAIGDTGVLLKGYANFMPKMLKLMIQKYVL
jgi:hypothetical protein